MFKEYKAEHSENRMEHEGDVVYARKNYYKYKPGNLIFLFKGRYEWMNKYIGKGDKVLEVGCGTGISKDFLRKDAKILLTDYATHPWIDKKVDALNTPFKKNTFDVIYCSNMVHHVPFPLKFFKEMNRILKPDGYLLIQEINCSFMMRVILRAMRHEGWSFNANPYDLKKSATDEKDLWSANCAIPNLLFDDLKKFNQKVPFFEVIETHFSEFFIFPLSGGVIAKTKTIQLSLPLLEMIRRIDNLLISLSPSFFALQRRIALRKNDNSS